MPTITSPVQPHFFTCLPLHTCLVFLSHLTTCIISQVRVRGRRFWVLQYSLLVCSSTAFTYHLLAHSAHLRCFVLTYQCQQKTSGNYLGLGDTMPSTYRFKSESYPKPNSNYVSEQFILTFVTKASLCQDELFGYASNLLQNDSRLSKKKKKKRSSGSNEELGLFPFLHPTAGKLLYLRHSKHFRHSHISDYLGITEQLVDRIRSSIR